MQKASAKFKPPDVEKDRDLLAKELKTYLDELKEDDLAIDELAKLVNVLREIKKHRA